MQTVAAAASSVCPEWVCCPLSPVLLALPAARRALARDYQFELTLASVQRGSLVRFFSSASSSGLHWRVTYCVCMYSTQERE